jgi:hypothetical protein
MMSMLPAVMASIPQVPQQSIMISQSYEYSFVGLEPFENREDRYEVLASRNSKVRYAMLVDTGAQDNLVGWQWLNRFLTAFSLPAEWTKSSA